MLEEFNQIDIFRPSIFDIAGNLMVALSCGIIISIVYRLTYRGPSYSSTFVNSLVLLSMITAVVILVIGNNLARAFGLVGAMSIIRFRTAVRDVQDIIFIFFALTVGMAAGVGLVSVAIIATIVVGLVIIILVSTGYSSKTTRRHLLQISYDNTEDVEGKLAQTLKKYCRKYNLVNIKNIGKDNEMEAYYQVRLRSSKKNALLIQKLRELGFVTNVNLFFDEDDTNSPTEV